MAASVDPQQILDLAKGEDCQETKVLQVRPEWDRLERSNLLPDGSAKLLTQLYGMGPSAVKIILNDKPELVRLIPVVLKNVAAEFQPIQYLLTLIGESCRADSSIWDVMVRLAKIEDMFTPFTLLLGRPGIDSYTADKAVQVLTSLISHAGTGVFSEEQVKLLTSNLITGQYKTSQTGVLEGLSNLLKLDTLRSAVFSVSDVLDKILNVTADSPPLLYRSVFCTWVASFNSQILNGPLKAKREAIVKSLKTVFQECRVEKVLRIALSATKNLMTCPDIAEVVVESGVLHSIQPLEYEKWRDNELYEEIRQVASRVANETQKHSNFERYERELKSGKLRWGFIHSEKFWLENAMNFERDQFGPVRELISLLTSTSTDPVTLAVVCHDLGEFARLHPTGKRIITKFNAKVAIMALMSNANRDVAREALLCTQKLMLNHWQQFDQQAGGAGQSAVRAK